MISSIKGFPKGTTFAWPLSKMKEVVELLYGKALLAQNRTPGEVPVFGTNGITGWHDTPLEIGPTVILGRKGMGPLGVEWCEGPFWVIDTAYYTSFSSQLDPRYFYYFTKFVGLNHLKDGTSNPSLSRDTFYCQKIPLPPPSVQQAIAHILGTLDDKINLNRRMNETLEAMARAIFKSWFVDFDGCTEFEDSELGPIPKGWRASCLGESCNVTMGQSPKGEALNEEKEGVEFFQGKRDFGFRFPTNRVYTTAPARMAKVGDTLISVRAPVGDRNMARTDCCIGRGLAALRHKSGYKNYTYGLISNLEETIARHGSDGTVFDSINKKQLLEVPCIEPSAEWLERYENDVGTIDSRIELALFQSETLAQLRDTLLPKLISGELRIPDAEKIVGDV